MPYDAAPVDAKPQAANDDAQERKSKVTLETLKQWYTSYEDATRNERTQAQLDRDYYDGIQWTEDEVAELNKSGQPVITINRIAPKVNFIVGQEIRQRTDPHAYPRDANADADAAEACTDVLRYIDDAEELDYKFSEVAEDDLIPGCAAVVVEIDKKTLDPKVRVVPWDRFWRDQHSRKRDFSDAKYLGVVEWLDEEDALDFYGKEAADVIASTISANNDGRSDTHDDRPSKFSWYDAKRNRVKVCECHWREGSTYYVAHFTGGGFLRKPAPSPYKDELGNSDCAMVAVSAFVNRQNERYGIVRAMRSPQDEVNKRRSKALHLLNVRSVIADKGAVDDPDSARHELARPDGYVEINPGARFEPTTPADFVQGQFNLLAEAKAEIDAVGPSSAGAAEASASSGRLFLAKQQAASAQLEPVFDAFRRFKKQVFRKIWCRIRQFWTFEKWVRVRDDEEKTGFRFVGINRKMSRAERLDELLANGTPLQSAFASLGIPDAGPMLNEVQQMVMMGIQSGQIPQEAAEQAMVQAVLQHPAMQLPLVVNDVSRLDVDIILDETPDTTVLEQEEFERLSNVGPTLIQAGFPPTMFAELLIEASDFRKRRKMLEIVRQASQPNPEAQQLQQQAAAMEAAQKQADIGKTQAQAQQAQATAAKMAAEAQTAPARAMGEQAYAAKTMAEAGRAMVPEMPMMPRRVDGSGAPSV